jgi:hypothetical protein
MRTLEGDGAISFAIDPGELQFSQTWTGANLASVKEETNHG